MSNVYSHESYEYDNLLLMGQYPVVTDTVLVGAGNSLARGSVIGIKTDTKEAYLVDKAKSDGTEIPYGVIADASFNPDTYKAVAYIKGEFNADSLIVAPDSTVDDYRHDMNRHGLIVRDTQNRGV